MSGVLVQFELSSIDAERVWHFRGGRGPTGPAS